MTHAAIYGWRSLLKPPEIMQWLDNGYRRSLEFVIVFLITVPWNLPGVLTWYMVKKHQVENRSISMNLVHQYSQSLRHKNLSKVFDVNDIYESGGYGRTAVARVPTVGLHYCLWYCSIYYNVLVFYITNNYKASSCKMSKWKMISVPFQTWILIYAAMELITTTYNNYEIHHVLLSQITK